jgi:hypothetical protein
MVSDARLDEPAFESGNRHARNMGLQRGKYLSRFGLLVAVACCAALARTCPASDDLAREAAALKARYAADLGRLAQWCRQRHLTAEAKKSIEPVAPLDPNKLVLPVLPVEVGSASRPEAATGDQAEWHSRWIKLRQDHAAALFALAQRSVRRHQAAAAYRLVLDAVQANPDHEAARRVLGYQKHQNQWRTPFEVRMLRGGMVWNEKFGWIQKADVPRYLRGERWFNGAWIDAASDAALHASITSGWDVESEHYRIRTNHSIEAAVALSVKLENLHRLWRQIFLGYYSSAAEVEALFGSRPPRIPESPRLEVVYFRDKEQYHQALKPIMPDVGISMGLYVAENRTAYFFAGSEDSERTTYHEATHQLFHQSRRVSGDAGQDANCWLIEGIAMYMETLRREGDCFVLGGLGDTRLEAARYHIEKQDFYLPFDKLVRMGVKDLQRNPQIAKLYSQIAAMTSFMVHDDDGRYREALVRCLAQIYDGSQDPDLLARLTGTDYAELDRQYQAYMKLVPREATEQPANGGR